MFGAGGAARAIGVELALAGATRIIVVNRGESRGRTLVDLLNLKTKTEAELAVQGDTYKIPTEADIVVNATSIGLYPDIDGRLNLDVESLRPSLVVADVILNPPRTRLVRGAEARGCSVLDGLGMIVNQGIIGIFTDPAGSASTQCLDESKVGRSPPVGPAGPTLSNLQRGVPARKAG
jgi:shikimate dehydrogenase